VFSSAARLVAVSCSGPVAGVAFFPNILSFSLTLDWVQRQIQFSLFVLFFFRLKSWVSPPCLPHPYLCPLGFVTSVARPYRFILYRCLHPVPSDHSSILRHPCLRWNDLCFLDGARLFFGGPWVVFSHYHAAPFRSLTFPFWFFCSRYPVFIVCNQRHRHTEFSIMLAPPPPPTPPRCFRWSSESGPLFVSRHALPVLFPSLLGFAI